MQALAPISATEVVITYDMLARSCPAGVPHSPGHGCDLIVSMVLNVTVASGGR